MKRKIVASVFFLVFFIPFMAIAETSSSSSSGSSASASASSDSESTSSISSTESSAYSETASDDYTASDDIIKPTNSTANIVKKRSTKQSSAVTAVASLNPTATAQSSVTCPNPDDQYLNLQDQKNKMQAISDRTIKILNLLAVTVTGLILVVVLQIMILLKRRRIRG